MSRLCLSYDAIFLSLFSTEPQFCEASLRPRFIRCFSKTVPRSPDSKYLADVSILTADKKLQDMKDDGEGRIHRRIYAKMSRLTKAASKSLVEIGVSIPAIENALSAYRQIELSNTSDSFGNLSAPIGTAYGHVFAGLPSRAGSSEKLRAVGEQFGRLTVLVDAIEDVDKDTKTGAYNIWKASNDLPTQRQAVVEKVATDFDSLRVGANDISPVAGRYIEAAKESTLNRLNSISPTTRLMTHPGIIAFMSAPFFADCCDDACAGCCGPVISCFLCVLGIYLIPIFAIQACSSCGGCCGGGKGK